MAPIARSNTIGADTTADRKTRLRGARPGMLGSVGRSLAGVASARREPRTIPDGSDSRPEEGVSGPRATAAAEPRGVDRIAGDDGKRAS